MTGGEIYRDGKFEFRQGPVFGNLVLADEINRAPAKVQSALLEAMEERQVTVAGKRYKLPDLFMVLATQNPIEQEGTYPLPEAQMDRFLMHVRIDYPSDGDEVKVLRLVRGEQEQGTKAAPPPRIPQHADLRRARRDRQGDAASTRSRSYIVALVAATRRPADFGGKLKDWIAIGASPRGSLALDRCSRVARLAARPRPCAADRRAGGRARLPAPPGQPQLRGERRGRLEGQGDRRDREAGGGRGLTGHGLPDRELPARSASMSELEARGPAEQV